MEPVEFRLMFTEGESPDLIAPTPESNSRWEAIGEEAFMRPIPLVAMTLAPLFLSIIGAHADGT